MHIVKHIPLERHNNCSHKLYVLGADIFICVFTFEFHSVSVDFVLHREFEIEANLWSLSYLTKISNTYMILSNIVHIYFTKYRYIND